MGFIKVISEAELLELPEGRAIAKRTRMGAIALTRYENKIYAFEDTCTHDDGPLVSAEGSTLEGPCVTCPRHGARFDFRTGEVLRMPATEPIAVYEVRVVDGQVEVNLD
ncbi:MAG: non-heme iron oxygenase ferredoxin subunit [Leptospirales bacterium]